MQRPLAAMTVVLALAPQAAFACFPLTEDALKATSWSITKTELGADLTVTLLNTGRFRNPVTNANGFVRFVNATGEKFELSLELQTAIAPGAAAKQHYSVIGWDRPLWLQPAEVTVITCVHSLRFADGGGISFN